MDTEGETYRTKMETNAQSYSVIIDRLARDEKNQKFFLHPEVKSYVEGDKSKADEIVKKVLLDFVNL